MGTRGFFVVWLLAVAVGAVASLFLLRRTWKTRRQVTRAQLIASVVVLTAGLLAATGTVGGLVRALSTLSGYPPDGDPSQAARALAEGISEAINCTAFALITWLPAFIVLTVMLNKRGRQSS